MAGAPNPSTRQNSHLNRDRQLVPIHGPAGTIPSAVPVKISIDFAFRDILIENVGDVVMYFTFWDPADHTLGEDHWKKLKPGGIFSAYCNARQYWLRGEGASYEVLYNAEGTMSFGEVSIVDPSSLRVNKQLVSDESLVTTQTVVAIPVITEIVPVGKKWRLQVGQFVCRAYGKFSVYLDGARIGAGVTSPDESNVRFDGWLPSADAVAGQVVEVDFVWSHGAITDLAAFIGYTEETL